MREIAEEEFPIRPKALVLTRYDQLGASSRIRLLQMVPLFEEYMDVRVQHLLSDRYVRSLSSRKRRQKGFHTVGGLVGRLFFLFGQVVARRSYECVILEQELIPNFPTRVEIFILRRLTSGSLIVDVDDGNHLRYENLHGLRRKLTGRKFQAIWQEADLVVCGSQQLVEDVAEISSDLKRIELIPSVPPTVTFVPIREAINKPSFIVGWIGGPSTSEDLSLIWGALRQVAQEYPLEVHIVGADVPSVDGLTIKCYPWTPSEEERLLQEMDVGIMPMSDTEFRRRKCGFKLIQYMAAGIPVIASNVGGNRWIVIEDERSAGYVVGSEPGWVSAFRTLLGNEAIRRARGSDALEIAKDRFSLSIVQAQWAACLHEMLVPENIRRNLE